LYKAIADFIAALDSSDASASASQNSGFAIITVASRYSGE
jgi:hypothetical protein